MSRFILPGFTILAFFAGSLAIRADDELDRIRENSKIAAQKLETDVSSAVTRSAKGKPMDAKTDLQTVLDRVTNSRDLTDTQRSRLATRLKLRISELDNTIQRNGVGQSTVPAPRDTEAPRKPASNPSTGSSATAKNFQDGIKGGLGVASSAQKQREKGIVDIQRDAERSAIPTDKEITFPKNWLAMSIKRNESVAQKLTDKEKKLLKALNSVMSVDYNNDDFRKVIDHLHAKTGLTILVDEASMKDANVEYDDRVTFKVEKATVRTILKKVLGDKGLSYIIKEGAIQVMTPKKAAEIYVIRTYPVDDLVTPDFAVQRLGPFFVRAAMLQKAQELINLIQSSTDPSYWQPNGPGSITFHEQTKNIVVRASTEMHYQLAAPGLFR